jgi:CIC family chloride channel protein
MQSPEPPISAGTTENANGAVPATLAHPVAVRFWLAVVLIGIGAGVSAAALTFVLDTVQQWVWPSPDANILEAATRAGFWRPVIALTGAGVVTGLGQLVLVSLSTGNSIEITSAIWFSAGRLPSLRTLGSALLSVIIVGMGASLGREGAPKQAGAVIANVACDRFGFSDDQRRLLVACGAGAGMAAVYDVPLGGALFAIEVLRGALALRLVLPALTASVIATIVGWAVLPNAPTYHVAEEGNFASLIVWALVAAPIIALASVGYVRMIAFADRNRPKGWRRLVAPVLAFALLGLASTAFPQLLGNGKELAQLSFDGAAAPTLLLALLVLKPLATFICFGSGGPGGLFTPSLSFGAVLGGVLGFAWSWIWPGAPPGLFAIVGAGAVVAATTQGPVSAIVLMIELTGRDRTFIIPMIVAAAIATLVARSIDPRSIYDARLTDAQLAERQRQRERPTH